MKTTIFSKTLRAAFLALTSMAAFLVDASQSWTYTYNSQGQVLTANGPRTDVADVTTNTYDSSGNLATITNAVGHVIQQQNYNGRGQPQQLIDVNGIATELTYHARGWLLTSTIKDPSGNSALDATTIYGYDNIGQMTSITLPDGNLINYEYDAAKRLKAISNNIGERIEYILDVAGNRTQEQIKAGDGSIAYTHQNAFDELSRLLDDSGANGQNTHLNYDANSNPTGKSDALGNQTQQAYDSLDRLKTVTDATQGNVNFTYDAQDNIKTVTDQRGITTTYHYNGLGNLTSIESPDTGITSFVHDSAGNIIQRTDARNIITLYTYDALNRLLTVSYPASPTENITYHYDSTANGNKGVGRLTSITNNRGSLSYHYDHRGNITGLEQIIDNNLYSLSYTYDLAGNISQMIYPSGRQINYSRNAVGNIIEITTKANATAPTETVVSNIHYLPFGDVDSFTYGNGVQTNLSFDLDYRLTGIDTVSSAIHGKLYSYDLANNIVGITDANNIIQSQTFSYDEHYRLSQEAGTYGTKTYTYDAVGNRTQRATDTLDATGNTITSNQNLTYAADSNRLIQRGAKDTLMDATGNTLSERNNKKEFVYNNANRLMRFIKEGITKADYNYNPLGQRIEKLKYKDNGVRTFHYIYDLQGQLLGSHVLNIGGSSVDFDYIWLNNKPVVRFKTPYKADGTIKTDKLKTTWLHTDHLNTPRIGTDDQQRIVWRWDSDAFGKGSVDSDPDGDGIKHSIALRFPGQYKDGESGMHYNYYRDYDPSLGRYVQSDPRGILLDFSDPQRQVATTLGVSISEKVDSFALNHNYGYAKQNSVMDTDSTGEVSMTIVVLVASYSGYSIWKKIVRQEECQLACQNDPKIKKQCDAGNTNGLMACKNECVIKIWTSTFRSAPLPKRI